MNRQHVLLLLVFPLLLAPLGYPRLFHAFPNYNYHLNIHQLQGTEAQQAIDAAQLAIYVAYNALLLADSTGALITDLISDLNGAIDVLNSARQSYNASDYPTAITQAENAENTATTVKEQAQMRYGATLAQVQAQVIIIAAVIAIIVVVMYLGLTRWRRYQSQKRRELLQMEVRLPDQDKEDELT